MLINSKKRVVHLIFLFCFSLIVNAQQVIDSMFLYQQAAFPSCHASTIAELPGGDLIASYFGGTQEGSHDVCIYTSRLPKGNSHWLPPMLVAKGEVGDTIQHPCWNPILYQIPGRKAPLMLWYKTGLKPETWIGHLLYSYDSGLTWQDHYVYSDGFLGPSKNKPIKIGNRLLCPSSWEENGVWLSRFEYTQIRKKAVQVWHATSPHSPASIRSIQPTILRHKDGMLQALCRTKDGRLSVTYSKDNGATWTPEQLTDIPNNNSGIDAVTLRDGRFVMVYNPVSPEPGKEWGQRYPLVMSISSDGLHWQEVITLESQRGEFSYPSIIQGADGTLHIVYTWNRTHIKYVHVNI